MDTDIGYSLTVYIEADDIYKEIAKDVKQDLMVQVMNQIDYLVNDGVKDRKEKGTKKCVIKRKLKFQDYENC